MLPQPQPKGRSRNLAHIFLLFEVQSLIFLYALVFNCICIFEHRDFLKCPMARFGK